MIVPDVNVLVHAFKREAEHHDAYAGWLSGVLSAEEDLGLVDAVLAGFLRIVTHPQVFARPAATADALSMVEALRGAPPSRTVHATEASWARLASMAAEDRGLRGNLVPDAFLASVAIVHGGRVATADHGFGRFPGLQWFDPLSTA